MKQKKIPYRFLLFINILLVLLTVLSAFAGDVDPRKFWLFSFLGLMFPGLIICNTLFIILWVFKKLRYSILSILCLLLFLKQVKNSFGFNLISSNIEQVDAFKIMTYNTSNFRNGVNKRAKVKAQREKAIKFITESVKPDILCTQELTGGVKNQLLQKFGNYHIHEYPNRVALIFSKYPIINKGQVDFYTNTNSCTWADIKIGNDIVRVYSVHLQSNRITKEADKLLNDKAGDKSLEKIKKILSRYRKYNVRRAEQADRVAKHIKKSPYPVIVCGDFNDPPQSYAYKKIKGNLNDAFVEKGFGLGVTFGGKIPGLRIDYILPSEQFKVIGYERKKNVFSDHYPVSSIIKMKDSP